MKKLKLFYTYIVASRSRVLYTGITSDLDRRMWQHRNGVYESFSKKYRCTRLVWYEIFTTPGPAITREKQIKGWLRSRKIALIEQQNPTWEDLAAPCFQETAGPSGRATSTQLRPNAPKERAPQDDDL
jgi:putative endonuclease